MHGKHARTWTVALAAAAIATLAAAPPAAAAEDGAGSAEITGFVDASWSGNLDTKDNTFGLDQVEIDVEQRIGESGLVRADVEWVKDGDGWTQDVEQGFLAFSPSFAPRWTFSLGKFNAPIGFELLDPPDMFQFSHALVFDYGLPTNLTGLSAASDLGAGFDVTAYVVNGWDDNNRPDSGAKTVGGRLGYDLGDLGGIGVSAIGGRDFIPAAAGSESAGTPFDRTVFDVDLNLTPAEGWIVGGEFNTGSRKEGGVESDWNGYLVMVHRDLNDWCGLTLRYDSLDDEDGAVFAEGGPQTRSEFTVAPTFVLGDGMGALVELRIDTSDRDVFVDADGKPADSTTSAAFEMTYTF